MRSVLGKGLDALISEQTAVATTEVQKSVLEIPLNRIKPNPKQPRQVYDETALSELAESIKQRGVLQPVLVTPGPDGDYQLIAGERRWRAAQKAGLSSIPAVIREGSDGDRFQIALIENIQREDLNSIEQAQGFARLAGEFQMTQEQIAAAMGKDRAVIANTLRLLNLPQEMQKALLDGEITASHARALVAMEDPIARQALFKRIIDEDLPVRAVEHAVRDLKQVAVRPHVRGAASPAKSPEVKALEEDLQRSLSRKVEMQVGADATKGWIRLEFYSLDDLDLLIAQLKNISHS